MEDLTLKTNLQNVQKPIQQKGFTFIFKPPFLKEPEKTFCEVCCRAQDKGEYANNEETLKMLICYGCSASVHLFCYGINTPYNIERSPDSPREDYMFLCLKCREKGPDFQPTCTLCNKKAGIYKHYMLNAQLQDEWVHPLCALLSNAFELFDPDEMIFELNSTKELGRRATKKQSCELCLGSQGTLFVCSQTECKKSIHLFCGLWEKAINNVLMQDNLEENLEENPSEWNIKVFLERSPIIRNYSLKSNPLSKEELEAIYKEYKTTEKKIQKQPEIEVNIPKKKEIKNKKKEDKTEKNKKKQDKKEENPEETSLPLELDEGFLAFSQAFEEKLRSENSLIMVTRRKEAETTTDDITFNDQLSSLRGGKFIFQCPDHKTPEIYCICDPIVQENPSMIACDYCDNWFHFNCVGLGNKTKEAANKEFPYYVCFQCKELLKFKQKLLKYDKKLRNTEGVLTLEEMLNFELLPKDPNISRFRLADSILVYRVILHKINKIMRNPPENSLESILKQFLDILSLLPWKIPRKFEDLKKAKYLAFSLNFLIENNAKKLLDEMEIQSCLSASGEFLIDKFKQNLEYKQKISNLEEFFSRKGLDLKPKLILNKHKSLLILDWILEYHEIFSRKTDNKKPSFEALNRLKQEINNFSSEESKFLEISILKKKLEEFEKTVEKIQGKLIPEKRPKMNEMSEKNYENYEEYLKDLFIAHKELIIYRLKNEEIIELEIEAQELEFEWPSLTLIIVEERQKLNDWINEYKAFKTFKVRDIEKLINKLDNLITQCPEMFELLELFKENKRWMHEFLEIQERFKQENSIIKVKEIQELIEKAEKRIDFEENMDFLKKKVKDFDDLKKKLQGLLSKPMEIAVWNRVKKDFGSMFHEIDLEEIQQFEERFKTYKEISQGLNQKKFSIEKLEEFLEKAKIFRLEEKLIKDIDHKVEKARALKIDIQGILQKKLFDYEDSVNISNLLLEIKQNKLDFEEISALKSILDSFEILEKLYAFWLEIEQKNKIQEENNNEANTNNKRSFSGMVEDLCNISKISENLSLLHQEIKPLILNLENLHIVDENLKKMVNIYKNLLWNHEVKTLLSRKASGQTDKINGESLELLYKDSKNFIDKTEFITEIEQLYTNYEEIKEKLEKDLVLLESSFENYDYTACDEQSIQSNLENIEKEFSKSNFIFEEIPKKLQLLRTWFDWLQKANELLKLLQENKEIDFENSSKLITLGQKINFPIKCSIYAKLQNLFDSAMKFKDKISQYSAQKRKAFEALKTAKEESANRKKFFDLNRTKPLHNDIIELFQSIINESQENALLKGLLKSEISDIESDLNQIKQFMIKYEAFKLKYSLEKLDNLKILPISDFECLKSELVKYRQDSFWDLSMFLKDWDQEFSRYEMKFHGLSILSGLQNTSLNFLRNYLKFAEESKDDSLYKADYMNSLKEIYNKGKDLNDKIDELKVFSDSLQEDNGGLTNSQRKQFINEKELEEIIENMRNSVINFGENKGFLEGLANKYKKVKDFYEKNQLKNSHTRVIHLEFMRFFEDLRLLPIEFPDFDFLQSQVRKYEILQRFLEKARKYLQMEQVPLKIAEGLLDRYSESRILINDYEKLHEKFTKSSQLMDELERKLALFDDFLPQSFEEYQQLNSKFENICIDFGDRTLKVRVLLFKQKIQFLEETREKSQNSKISSTVQKMSFKQLKHDLQYGYSLLLSEEIIEKLQNQIKSLEKILLEIGDKFKEIEEIKNVTILEDYNPIFLNFIDLSEELIEYKMTLAYEKEAKISVDLGVKQYFEQYKEGSDCIKVLRNLGITPCNRGGVDPLEISRIFIEETYNIVEGKERTIKKFAYLKESIKESSSKSKEKNFVSKAKSLPFKESKDKTREKPFISKDKVLPKEINKEKNSISKEKSKDNLKDSPSDRPLGKRKINPTTFGNEFITGFIDDEEHNSEKLSKKLKKETITKENIAMKPSMLKPLGLKDPPIKEFIKETKEKENKSSGIRIVTNEKREELLNKLDKLAKANPKLKKTNKNLKSFLQILENQIFGTFHNNPSKYESESQSLIYLFEKLLKFPFISGNLLSKNFRVEIVQKLMKNTEKLSQIETNLKAKEQEKLEKNPEKLPTASIKPPLLSSSSVLSKKPSGEQLEKKLKSEQYDPFEKTVNKKVNQPPQPPKEDPLKELFRDIKEKSQQNPEKKPLSLLALTEASRAKLSEPSTNNPEKNKTQGKAFTKSKTSILENYEALSSDDDKQKKTQKNEQNSTKKEEKKLEFSDDESSFIYDKLSKNKRYSLDNSEDSFDNASRSSGAYDPMTESKKIEIEQAILFDPDNEENTGISEKYLQYTQKFAPKGSVLKIFEGKFRLNHLLSIHANFLTIEEISVLRDNFPKILLKDKSTSLKLSGTTDFKAFSDFYFSSSASKNRRVMVAGWVQPVSDKYRKSLENFAEELVQTNKIGGYKFGKANSASFHFLSTKQLLSDPNMQKLEFKIRSKNHNDKPVLIYFLTTKQPASRTSEPSLEPEIVDLYEPNKLNEFYDLNKRVEEPTEKHEDLTSPLTNEEKSPIEKENEPKEEKNDDDIEEIIKKMDSNKQQTLYEEKSAQPNVIPATNKSIFEQANIQAEELTPVKEGEEEDKPTNNQPLEPENETTKHNQDLEFNDIIEELQKMKPEELKEFVASFEPDSRGKIASLLKDLSKEEVLVNKNADNFEPQINPASNVTAPTSFYNPLYQAPHQTVPPQQQFYPNMGGYQGGFNRSGGKMYHGNNMRQPNYNRFGGNKQMYGQYPQQMQNNQQGYNYMMGGQGMNRNPQGFQGNVMMGAGGLGQGNNMMQGNPGMGQPKQNNEKQ